MSINYVTSYTSLYLRGSPRTGAFVAGLMGVSLIMGGAGTLDAQDRERIVFETGVGALSAVTIYVRDQERALRWYTERLGFEVRRDDWYGSGERVLAIAPPGQEAPLIYLESITSSPDPQNPSPVGGQSGWVFQVTDLIDSYARLRDLDVRFTQPPRETIDGWRATFVDLYGNRWGLWEPGGS